jgi:hypothetical protein
MAAAGQIARLLCALFVGATAGLLFGKSLFGRPFGMGDDTIPIVACTVLGMWLALAREVRLANAIPVDDSTHGPSLAWRFGHAIHRTIEYCRRAAD